MMNTGMPNSTSWNIKRRRDFSELDPGTQVPGYGGYIEQYKYHVGDTYGNATNKLSKMRVGRHPIVSSLPESFNQDRAKVGTGLTTSIDMSGRRRVLTLPKSTGDNKLTEKMVPGYTGYIPRRPFKFGNTYKEDCDVCIDDFMNNTQDRSEEIFDLRKTVAGSGRLRPLTDEKTVIKTLNEYRDTHPLRPILLSDKRFPREAPVPGYQGFIPRQGVTEIGLGTRYHVVCDKSFNAFHDATERHASQLTRSAPANFTLPDNKAKASIQLTREDKETQMQRRLYKPIGMVPKYTGYMPQNRYKFGHTYGDSTRSLPVCFHDKGTFGEYVATGAPQVAM
ncbi:ciliary microtubule inner protein 2B-like [Apostichopus japonicus]|uniref:ciliary microtubule inner protein 2B-like n=1 Tax=Stichopus japonicus TaxID=307972 RepID=UPI003AB390F0